MKNKSSNNILNTDSLPERNQESTEKGEIKLLDVVALTQDVPQRELTQMGMIFCQLPDALHER